MILSCCKIQILSLLDQTAFVLLLMLPCTQLLFSVSLTIVSPTLTLSSFYTSHTITHLDLRVIFVVWTHNAFGFPVCSQPVWLDGFPNSWDAILLQFPAWWAWANLFIQFSLIVFFIFYSKIPICNCVINYLTKQVLQKHGNFSNSIVIQVIKTW